MQRFLFVCGAGAIGCGARYLIGLAMPAWATLIVNLVGSFLIALVLETALRTPSFSPDLRVALATGFIGGLTTYSAFNYETSKMILEGHYARGLALVSVTLFGCFAMGIAGLALARRVA